MRIATRESCRKVFVFLVNPRYCLVPFLLPTRFWVLLPWMPLLATLRWRRTRVIRRWHNCTEPLAGFRLLKRATVGDCARSNIVRREQSASHGAYSLFNILYSGVTSTSSQLTHELDMVRLLINGWMDRRRVCYIPPLIALVLMYGVDDTGGEREKHARNYCQSSV